MKNKTTIYILLLTIFLFYQGFQTLGSQKTPKSNSNTKQQSSKPEAEAEAATAKTPKQNSKTATPPSSDAQKSASETKQQQAEVTLEDKAKEVAVPHYKTEAEKKQEETISAQMLNKELKLEANIHQQIQEEQSTSLIKSLKYKETQLDILKDRFKSYEEIIFSRLAHFTVIKEKTEIKFFELKSLLEVSSSSPYEFQMVYGQLLEINSNYKQEVTDGLTIQNKLEELLASMEKLDQSITHLQTKDLNPEQTALIEKIKKSISFLILTLKHYNDIFSQYFDPVKDLGKHLQASINKISKQSDIRLVNQFFMPSAPPISTEFWNLGLLKNDLRAIIPTARMAIWEKSPDSPEDWLALAILAVILWLPFLVICRFIIGKKLAFIKAKSENTFFGLLNSVFFISSALFLYLSLFIIYFPDNLLITSIAIILTAYAAIKIIIALKFLNQQQTSTTILLPFFQLYVIAVFFQLANLPMRIFTLVWLVSILVLILRLYHYYKSQTLNPIGNILAKLFIPFAILNFILVLLGYLYLAHFLYKMWFIGILSFSLALNLSKPLKKYASVLQREKGQLLLGTSLKNIGIPLLWFFCAIILLAWLSQQLGHIDYSIKLLTTQISWRNTKIDIITVSIILLLFFIFKTINNTFYSYLNLYYKTAPSKGLLPSIKHFIGYSLWIIYIIIAFQILGINMTSLSLIIGGISMGIGFGLRDIVNNFIGGIVLIFNKEIRPTDIIQLDDGTWAQVLNINFRSIIVKTYNNAIVSIPNSKLLSSKLTNWSLGSPEIKIEIPLKLPHTSGIEAVEKLLIDTAKSSKNVLETPPPTVLLKNIDKDTMEVTLNVWFDSIDNIDEVNVNIASISNLRKKIWENLTEHKLFETPATDEKET